MTATKFTLSDGKTDDPYGILSGLLPGNGHTVVDVDTFIKTLSLGVIIPRDRTETRTASDSCLDCHKRLEEYERIYKCPDCQRLYEPSDAGDDDDNEEPILGRLTIVGANSGYYQSELDRSKPVSNEKTQIRTNYEELLKWNKEFANKKDSQGGNYGPIPLNVLEDVAADYYLVQQQGVKRMLNKKTIIAALINHHCIQRGFTRTQTEIACFAKLPTNGIARGDSSLHSIIDDNNSGITLDVNADRTAPHIMSTFSRLGLDDGNHELLKKAVFEVVKAAEDSQIGVSSKLGSKVIAATYNVLSYTQSRVTIAEVVAKCKIRKHTLNRFLTVLKNYRSYFADVYAKYGLLKK